MGNWLRMTSRRGQVLAVLAVVLVAWAVAHAPFAQTPSELRPDDVGLSSPRLERLTGALHQYVEDGQLAGGVMLVARHGRVAYHEAFGLRDRESRDPMRTDSLFRIASQTKAIVSVMILMLQEDGRLLISDPVSRYLPEFEGTSVAVPLAGGGYDVVDAERPITIRDLLTHTSGIGYGGGGPAAELWEEAGITGWYFADRDEPVGATVQRMAALPFEAHPGERWIYGYNIDILGAVAEQAGGMPLDRLLQTRIFEPLGMDDTFFYVPESERQRLVTVYSLGPSGLTRAPDEGGMVSQGAYASGPRTSFSGGAGLVSTASDYGRFLQMMLNDGELDGTRLLSRNTVALMTTSHLGDLPFRPGQGFGLGFSVVTDVGARGIPGSPGEYGWGGAYHSTYWVDPVEDMLVVYLTQQIPAGGVDDHAKIRALVYAALE